jgi:oligopeptide transport system permease protein
MSVNSKDFNGGKIATEKPESLFRDALSRLLKNKAAIVGAIIIVLLIFIALFADQIAPTHFAAGNLTKENSVPQWLVNIFSSMKGYANISTEFTFGSDAIGRDLLSRIIYGTRVSLAVAFIGPILALLIGVTYGSISGYFGGKVDNMMMRFVDVMYGFPSILFIILMMAFFRTSLSDIQPGSFAYSLRQLDESMGGLFFIFVGIGMTSWETMARLTRGQILSIKEKEFVEAARSIGASDMRIIFKHILPNILGPLIVAETLAIPGYISTEAFLSYIGLGVNPPTPSWGAMIADGARSIRSYPYQVLLPALALAITMFAFNFLGDGLRDAFDPKLRGRE